MKTLFLALALTAPADRSADDDHVQRSLTCSVTVGALDAEGKARSAQTVSASVAPAVIVRGRVLGRGGKASSLLFDVYNPNGQRYQVLRARPRVVKVTRKGSRVSGRTSMRVHEATLAVVGSSIAWTSMNGSWRVEPRLEGTNEPCGRAKSFTILP